MNILKINNKVSLLFILSLLLLGSCVKGPINGKLDGQWQIMTVENKTTGEISTPENPRLYFCIYRHIFEITHTFDKQYPGNMVYDEEKKTIDVDFAYLYLDYPEHVELLNSCGIYTNPVKFDILKLDSRQLILSTPESLITCRRF